MERELQRLQPVPSPGELVSQTPRGIVRRPVVNLSAAQSESPVERLLLVTEHTQYLFCQRVTDDSVTFYVAKPEGFYTTEEDGVSVAYPDAAGTEIMLVTDQTNDTRVVNFPVDPVPRTRTQRITPAYREGFSIIYAMKLAEPLDFPGDVTCTHVDLNIGEVRRWETLAPLDGGHEVPITFS